MRAYDNTARSPLAHALFCVAPAPTLILDANHTLTVQFEDPDEPNLAHELLLTVTRPGSTNATRPALPGSRELRGGARYIDGGVSYCFRVAAVHRARLPAVDKKVIYLYFQHPDVPRVMEGSTHPRTGRRDPRV